jgi:hypothetical protein
VFDENGEILARNSMFFRMLGISQKDGEQILTLDDAIRAASKSAHDPQQFAADWRALTQDCREATQEELDMAAPVRQTIARYARPILDTSGSSRGAWRCTVVCRRSKFSNLAWRRPRCWRRWDRAPRTSCTS